ncbi:hypothetical protein HOH45_07550, partial [bacterium]|nr:hypothetical protein [bacterium]
MNKIIAIPSERRTSTGNGHKLIREPLISFLQVKDLHEYGLVNKELSTELELCENIFRDKFTKFVKVIQVSSKEKYLDHLKRFDVSVGLYGADKMT